MWLCQRVQDVTCLWPKTPHKPNGWRSVMEHRWMGEWMSHTHSFVKTNHLVILSSTHLPTVFFFFLTLRVFYSILKSFMMLPPTSVFLGFLDLRKWKIQQFPIDFIFSWIHCHICRSSDSICCFCMSASAESMTVLPRQWEWGFALLRWEWRWWLFLGSLVLMSLFTLILEKDSDSLITSLFVLRKGLRVN